MNVNLSRQLPMRVWGKVFQLSFCHSKERSDEESLPFVPREKINFVQNILYYFVKV